MKDSTDGPLEALLCTARCHSAPPSAHNPANCTRWLVLRMVFTCQPDSVPVNRTVARRLDSLQPKGGARWVVSATRQGCVGKPPRRDRQRHRGCVCVAHMSAPTGIFTPQQCAGSLLPCRNRKTEVARYDRTPRRVRADRVVRATVSVSG